jgi:hypothetical protein
MMSDLTVSVLRGALEREGRDLEQRLGRVLFIENLYPEGPAERFVISRRVEVDGTSARLVATIEPRARDAGEPVTVEHRLKVADPLVELLAIKLYEHDTMSDGAVDTWPVTRTCWAALPERDRKRYRAAARGEEPYGEVS